MNGILIGFAVLVSIYLFIRVYPPLGGLVSAKKKAQYQRSPQFENEKFRNELPTSMDLGFSDTLIVLWDFVRGGPDRKPKHALPMQSCDPIQLASIPGVTITWLGHSAILLTWKGKTLLIDPMFGRAASPFPWLAGNRYSQGLPFEWSQLPTIDAVFFSHDHYDHLDYGSIQRIKKQVKHFFVPLGVSAHLESWGVDPHAIREMDWWDELNWEGLTIACTPARHFSGRRMLDRFATLWCSWVIADEQTRLFYSGDSGYGPHFQRIGERYGPFDWSLMECGQYDLRWKDIHLLPEEAVQAVSDVRAQRFIPIHWAAFTLALHDWFEPIDRVGKEAERLQVSMATPQIGETVFLDGDSYPSSKWWISHLRSTEQHPKRILH